MAELRLHEKMIQHYRLGNLLREELFVLMVVHFLSWGESASTLLNDEETKEFLDLVSKVDSPGEVLMASSVGEFRMPESSFQAIKSWSKNMLPGGSN